MDLSEEKCMLKVLNRFGRYDSRRLYPVVYHAHHDKELLRSLPETQDAFHSPENINRPCAYGHEDNLDSSQVVLSVKSETDIQPMSQVYLFSWPRGDSRESTQKANVKSHAIGEVKDPDLLLQAEYLICGSIDLAHKYDFLRTIKITNDTRLASANLSALEGIENVWLSLSGPPANPNFLAPLRYAKNIHIESSLLLTPLTLPPEADSIVIPQKVSADGLACAKRMKVYEVNARATEVVPHQLQCAVMRWGGTSGEANPCYDLECYKVFALGNIRFRGNKLKIRSIVRPEEGKEVLLGFAGDDLSIPVNEFESSLMSFGGLYQLEIIPNPVHPETEMKFDVSEVTVVKAPANILSCHMRGLQFVHVVAQNDDDVVEVDALVDDDGKLPQKVVALRHADELTEVKLKGQQYVAITRNEFRSSELDTVSCNFLNLL